MIMELDVQSRPFLLVVNTSAGGIDFSRKIVIKDRRHASSANTVI